MTGIINIVRYFGDQMKLLGKLFLIVILTGIIYKINCVDCENKFIEKDDYYFEFCFDNRMKVGSIRISKKSSNEFYSSRSDMIKSYGSLEKILLADLYSTISSVDETNFNFEALETIINYKIDEYYHKNYVLESSTIASDSTSNTSISMAVSESSKSNESSSTDNSSTFSKVFTCNFCYKDFTSRQLRKKHSC